MGKEITLTIKRYPPFLSHCVSIIHETMCNHAQYFITGCITTTYSHSECTHVSKHLTQ